jgi:putative peptidoglycan lipid II flippase
LAAFALGLPAYVLIKALVPGFHAREDTKTPVKIAIVAVIANIVLALILMQFLAHVGIALATALTAWFNAAMLGWILVRRGHLVFDARLLRCVPRLVLAAAAMAGALWVGAAVLAGPLNDGEPSRIAALAALVAGAMAVYAALAVATGAVRFGELRAAMKRE